MIRRPTNPLLDALEPAMLPLDGAISDAVPEIIVAFEAAAKRPIAQSSYIDLTAGSCLLPLYFGARGVKRLVVNDTASRTAIAAHALFGGRPIDGAVVERLALQDQPKLRPHVPSFHFACDYFLKPAADLFDRLYHADLPAEAMAPYRYLALLWAQGFAMDEDGGFPLLMTHEHDQLRDLNDGWWEDYVARAENPMPVLAALTETVNRAIGLQKADEVELHQGDMATVIDRIRLDADCLVTMNPPTNGIDEYVIDDQIVHSLLANRLLPLSKSRESAADFWERRLRRGLDRLPRGALALVWGGDGVRTLDYCRRVWLDYATIVHTAKVSRNRKPAGWAILRRN